ncbi:MAG: hypothetical protein GYB36_08640 [Alphaproteobacteria bacterium]|nr:hypothetical protein [Alphaproteobacteria bacterium]
MSRLRSVKLGLIALSALSVSACVSLLPEVEPAAVYRLSSPEPRMGEAGLEPVIVQVQRPVAPSGLSGDEIAVAVADRHLAYMSAARWIAPAPVIIQNLIIDTFHAGEDGVEPVHPADAIRARFELRLDLREFEAHYDRGRDVAPTVRVRIAARLIESDGRELVASQVFSANVRAGANRAGAIVTAFNEASTQVATELANWTGDASAR